MKKIYDKPYVHKVAFSYLDQVVALSGGMGTINNRDGTERCQHATYGVCNKYWNVPAGNVSLFSLEDCREYPSD